MISVPDNSTVRAVRLFATLRTFSDTDLGAHYVYLKVLPARRVGPKRYRKATTAPEAPLSLASKELPGSAGMLAPATHSQHA